MFDRKILPLQNASHSERCLESDINNLDALLTHLKKIPYQRISNSEETILVLIENRGTCSSKHAFVKKVAIEQGWKEVKLLLVIYKMNSRNTPGIGDTLVHSPLEFIPEAHTILEINGQLVDITFPSSDFKKLQPDVISFHEIEADQAGIWKKAFHRNWIKAWQKRKHISMDFEAIWGLREQCIANLQEF